MTRRARVLAGATLAVVLVSGSLAVGTDTTLARWQTTHDLEGPAITTGSLGLSAPTQRNSFGWTWFGSYVDETSFTENVVEIDQTYQDWVALYTTVTPQINGTGLGAVVTARYSWPTSYTDPREAWSLLGVHADFSRDGMSYTTLTYQGTLATAADGITMQVLLWPQGAALPAGWTEATTIRFTTNPAPITFRLRIVNVGHDYDWVLGATAIQTASPYRPVNPTGGTVTVTVTQVGANGGTGRWSVSNSSVRLPTIFNSYWTSDQRYTVATTGTLTTAEPDLDATGENPSGGVAGEPGTEPDATNPADDSTDTESPAEPDNLDDPGEDDPDPTPTLEEDR